MDRVGFDDKFVVFRLKSLEKSSEITPFMGDVPLSPRETSIKTLDWSLSVRIVLLFLDIIIIAIIVGESA